MHSPTLLLTCINHFQIARLHQSILSVHLSVLPTKWVILMPIQQLNLSRVLLLLHARQDTVCTLKQQTLWLNSLASIASHRLKTTRGAIVRLCWNTAPGLLLCSVVLMDCKRISKHLVDMHNQYIHFMYTYAYGLVLVYSDRWFSWYVSNGWPLSFSGTLA